MQCSLLTYICMLCAFALNNLSNIKTTFNNYRQVSCNHLARVSFMNHVSGLDVIAGEATSYFKKDLFITIYGRSLKGQKFFLAKQLRVLWMLVVFVFLDLGPVKFL